MIKILLWYFYLFFVVTPSSPFLFIDGSIKQLFCSNGILLWMKEVVQILNTKWHVPNVLPQL